MTKDKYNKIIVNGEADHDVTDNILKIEEYIKNQYKLSDDEELLYSKNELKL